MPTPATVLIIPLPATLRMRLFSLSAIRNPPSGVIAMPPGDESCAALAGPPSPAKPWMPLPATVVMTPLALTLRMRPDAVSAIRKPPSGVTATSPGLFSFAAVAAPPSPLPVSGKPPPASVTMMPVVVTWRMVLLPSSAIRKLPSARTATALGELSCAASAGPLSPTMPGAPFPATVVMTPAEETLRTRLLARSAIR